MLTSQMELEISHGQMVIPIQSMPSIMLKTNGTQHGKEKTLLFKSILLKSGHSTKKRL